MKQEYGLRFDRICLNKGEELQKTNMSSDEEASHSGGPLEAGATGPLLSPGPRPAAASSNGSVGPQEGQILCNKNVDGHVVSAQGSSKEGQVPENTGCGSGTPQFCNLFLMSPTLLMLFKSLGAENRPYTAQEIWRFLYTYLLRKRHLFDKTDNSFVNCDGDPVGAVFGVKRFHINDVRYLLGKHVYKTGVVPPIAGGITRSATHNGVCRDPSGCSTEVAGSTPRSPFFRRAASSDEAASSLPSVSADPTHSRQGMAVSNGLVLVTDSAEGKNNQSDANALQGVSSLSGVSVDSRRIETDVSGLDAKPVKKTNFFHVVLEEDDLPLSNSDAETVYSYQEYETEWCRNSESEGDMSGDLDDQLDFVEYEIASDDAVPGETLSDDDDSESEDVELAMVTLMYEDDKEDEVCWGDDDSDSESISASDTDTTDTDPDLAKERWACLKCNLKNKAFMRYCEKCWQQRKDWLPDCPKGKKRRKPRPKKPKKSRRPQNGLKARAPLESTSRLDSTDGSQECKYIDSEGNSINEVTLAEVEKSKRRLSRTLSDASTVSIDEVIKIMSAEEASGSCRPQEAACSQDSGIGMSQESLSEATQSTSAIGIGMSQESLSEATQSTSASGISEKCSEIKVENRDDSNSKSALEDAVLIEVDKILCEDSSDSDSAKSKVKEEIALPSTSYAKQDRVTGILKTESEPVHRTLKRKHPVEVYVATCIKRSKSAGTQPEEESLSESDNEVDPKDQAQSLIQLLQSKIDFLQSEEGKKWIGTPDSKQCTSHLLESEKSDFPWGVITDISAHRLCSLCYIRPKNGIVVHGRKSHQFSCYPCAKRLLDSKARCPICRRKIHMVTKNVVA